MIIVIIGPDGSGKTTLALSLQAYFLENGKHVQRFELNYGILPQFREIASFFLRKKILTTPEPGQYLSGMVAKPNSPLRGSIYMIWYSIDYLLGNILYKFNSKSIVQIFARYAYDYGFQRSYKLTPRFFYKLIVLLAPTPDFVFTIKRDPSEIFDGKPELTIHEINRQQLLIHRELRNKSYFFEVSGEGGVQATKQRILNLIFKTS